MQRQTIPVSSLFFSPLKFREISLWVTHTKTRDQLVKDLSHRDVVTIPSNATLWDAADVMGKRGVKRLPVVDDAGTCVGMLSNRDIRQRVGIPFLDPKKDHQEQIMKVASDAKTALLTHKVAECMSHPVKTCSPEDNIVVVAKLLRVGDVSSLAVVNGQGVLTGIVTRSDLIDQLIRVYEPLK